MNKIISLTKVLLKNSFQKYSENNKKTSKVGKIILYGILLVYLMGIFGFLSYGLITTLQQVHQEAMFIGIFLLGLALLTIIQSIISATNVFYFSKDLDYILPLPLKPREILISKLNVILVTEYVMELIFAVAPIIVYGILTSAGAMFYIVSLLVLIIFPIIPILIATFIIMVIMSFSKGVKNKDRFKLIAPLLGIALALILSFGTSELSEADLLNALTQANSMVEMVSDSLPIIKPGINAIVNASFIEFLKLLGITAICYIVFILIGNKLYFRGAVGNLSSGAKKGKNITGKDIKIKSVGKSYVAKEFKMLFKNPIFFVQCVLPSVLMPVVFLGIFIVSINSNNSQESINEFQKVLGGFIETPIGLAAILAITEFLTSMLYIAPTAISRDGQNAIFMKYIPVPYYKQLIYKGIPNVVFGTITSLIVLIFIYVVAKPSLVFLLTALILNLILLILQTLLMELVDLRKPKLEWSTEYAVVKQNMNLLWPFVLNLIEIGIIFIVSIPLSFTNYLITAVILVVLHIIITYFVNRYMCNNQDKLFDKVS